MEPFHLELEWVWSWLLGWWGEGSSSWAGTTHVVLGEVDEVLQVNVVPVRLDVVVDEKVELIFDPVFKDEGEDPRRQLQEEDQTQEHGELEGREKTKQNNEQQLQGWQQKNNNKKPSQFSI